MISEQEISETQDTEITLGTGKLLGIFVGLVVLCAVFFAFGFSMGRNSVKAGLSLTEPTDAEATSSASSKPAPANTLRPAPVAVQQNETTVAEETKAAQKTEVTPVAVSETAPTAEARPAGGSGYVVQVAAVSKQEDADALVGALKKKGYPVFIADAPTDKLLHVQIGPFADIKDAEAMRARLTGDGYNPILKR